MKQSLKRFLRDWLPPVALRAGRAVLDVVRPAPFEFVGHRWPDRPEARGWDSPDVARAREQIWYRLVASLDSTEPMGVDAEDLARPWQLSTDTQSLHTTFAYCLALAGRNIATVRVLDWGGDTGTYYLVARKLLPDVPLEWHCADLPHVVALGRQLNPDVTFHEDDSWTAGSYDFIFSSSALQYLEDWKPTLRTLARLATEWLYVTRMPFISRGPSFVALQRVREYGTEYYGWVLNRGELVGVVESEGLELVQSFVNHRGPRIADAPEQNVYMGFLFRRVRPRSSDAGPAAESSSEGHTESVGFTP